MTSVSSRLYVRWDDGEFSELDSQVTTLFDNRPMITSQHFLSLTNITSQVSDTISFYYFPFQHKMILQLLCALVVLRQHVEAVDSVDPVVHTKVGVIRGQAATDGDYNMFRGIPYAKVDKTNPFGVSTYIYNK